ncbi:hypothetical protein [Jiella sp. M17.18]|uniref:hypothetical protein n=1 Tax=Jiella sp. M17.18 TaxID=3234247 RepID=UPI0034E00B5F
MDRTLREVVKSHVARAGSGSFIDVPELADRIGRKLGYDGSARRLMLIRLIMSECAAAGLAMRLDDEAAAQRREPTQEPGAQSVEEAPFTAKAS